MNERSDITDHLRQVSEYWAGRDLPDLPIWRPIETAPKDGRKFLIACGDGLFTAEWNPRMDCFCDCVDMAPFGAQPDWDTAPWAPATHWMPLPAPPVSGDL